MSISDNKLVCLPDLSNRRATLRKLSASKNRLGDCQNDVQYKYQFSHLTFIDIADNGLHVLPNIVKRASQLTHLRLNNNLFKILPELNSNVQYLPHHRPPFLCCKDNIWLGKRWKRAQCKPIGQGAIRKFNETQDKNTQCPNKPTNKNVSVSTVPQSCSDIKTRKSTLKLYTTSVLHSTSEEPIHTTMSEEPIHTTMSEGTSISTGEYLHGSTCTPNMSKAGSKNQPYFNVLLHINHM